MWSGFQSTCHPNASQHPLMPLHPVSGSAVTLYWGPMWSASQSTCHPKCPLTPPANPLTLPDAPTPLPVGVLQPCTWVQCGQPPSPPATPNAPWHPICPYTPNAPTPLSVGVLWPYTGVQYGWPPSPPATPNAPTPLTPLWCPLHPLTPAGPLILYTPTTLMLPLHPYTPDGLLTPVYPCWPPDAPHAPMPLPVGVLWPCTGVQCGQLPSPPGAPYAPWWPNACTPPDAPTPPTPLMAPWVPTSLHPIMPYTPHPLLASWAPTPAITLHPLIPLTPCWCSIVINLQLAIFMSMSSLQYTICSCQEYVFRFCKFTQLLQYLPKHALQNSSCFTTLKHQQSGLVFNCHHFATDHLHEYVQLTIYHL